MRRLNLGVSLNDNSIAGIALCVDKIEELAFCAAHVTMDDWEILSTAINKRSTAVS